MKIDYKFMKEILKTIENNDTHSIEYASIGESLNIPDWHINDKFIGHLKLLIDEDCIDSRDQNYGIEKIVFHSPEEIMTGAECRLTARGHKFLKVLEDDTVFNKIKDKGIDIAIDVGSRLLSEALLSASGLKT